MLSVFSPWSVDSRTACCSLVGLATERSVSRPGRSRGVARKRRSPISSGVPSAATQPVEPGGTFMPVTIEPSSVLPGPLQDLLPQAFRVAETSCGSVARPHRPAGFGGVLSSIATLLNTECTHAVRARLWSAVWLGLGGLAVLLVGLVGFDRRGCGAHRLDHPALVASKYGHTLGRCAPRITRLVT